MHPSIQSHMVEVGPLAPGKLCCLTPHHFSGPSDIPPPLTGILPVSPDLTPLTAVGIRRGTVGLSGPTSVVCLRMLSALPRVPYRCIRPLLPGRHWPSPSTYRVGAYPTHVGSSLNRILPAISSGLTSRGCTVRVMLRPADLASTPDWVRPASSRCEPSRCVVEASSACMLPPKPASSLHT